MINFINSLCTEHNISRREVAVTLDENWKLKNMVSTIQYFNSLKNSFT